MLVNLDPPRESLTVLATALSTAATDERLACYLDQPVQLDRLTATAPHPFFVLDTDDLGDDLAPPVARYAGWRYLLEVNQRVVALATTVLGSDNIHTFGGVGTGPAVSAVVYAVHIADELLKDEPEEMTIAVVDAQEVHMTLLQVSNDDGSRVAFLPIGLATSLHPARLYSRAQVREEIRRMIRSSPSRTAEGEPIGG